MLTLERSANIRALIANSSGELGQAAKELLRAYDEKFMEAVCNKEIAHKQSCKFASVQLKNNALQAEVDVLRSVNDDLKVDITEAFIKAELNNQT